jgi:hypothetical protein
MIHFEREHLGLNHPAETLYRSDSRDPRAETEDRRTLELLVLDGSLQAQRHNLAHGPWLSFCILYSLFCRWLPQKL